MENKVTIKEQLNAIVYAELKGLVKVGVRQAPLHTLKKYVSIQKKSKKGLRLFVYLLIFALARRSLPVTAIPT